MSKNSHPGLIKCDGFTLDASTSPYIYTVSGQTWTANEYQDKFLKVGTQYFAIMSNTSTNMHSYVGKAAGTEIWDFDTIISLDNDDFNTTLKHPNGNAQLSFEELTIDASSYNLTIYNSNTELVLKDIKIQSKNNRIEPQSDKITMTRAHLVVSTGPGIDDDAYDWYTTYNGVSVRKSGIKGSNGIYVTNNRLFKDIYVENFTYGFYLSYGNYMGNQSSTEMIIGNCTYAFGLRNSTLISFPVIKPYLDTVNYTFGGLETIEFGTKVYINTLYGTPDVSMFHSSVAITTTDPSVDIVYVGV